ncbi:MAG: tRNA pseudouridine(38-40) synthase TruA [Ponticaulis sp.]|nr:tRNA pseudouridine(38-40) synthase TruA [Ponticaulis sp.]
MPRYKLTIEYDGRPFAGWQRQADQPSVQQSLEDAAASLNGGPVTVQGAGRTDARVHGTGQVAHLDLQKDLPADKVMDAINFHLKPAAVAIIKSERADDEFHARFDAKERHYLYRISNRRAPLTLDAGLAWRVSSELDYEAMHAAAQALVGQHDFSTFRDSQCQANSPIRTLNAISVNRMGEEIHIRCRALSFLHRQVRSMVGSLADVGRGKENVSWVGDILAQADRAACGPVAPPDGLYLTRVDY